MPFPPWEGGQSSATVSPESHLLHFLARCKQWSGKENLYGASCITSTQGTSAWVGWWLRPAYLLFFFLLYISLTNWCLYKLVLQLQDQGLERSKELQPREGQLWWLWDYIRKKEDGGAAGLCKESGDAVSWGTRSSPKIHPWERAFLSSPTPLCYGSPAPIEFIQSPSLCSPLIPCHSNFYYSRRKAGLAPGQRARQEYCGKGLSLPLAIPV